MNYLWDDQLNLFQRLNHGLFAYSDGVEVEDRLYSIVANAKDRGTFSSELAGSITDWPTEYHLSRARHCLLRPLAIPPVSKVLELGCGCGAITRYLGEIGANVVAVEGSLSRARVAAERCRDLPNVRTFVDDLLRFETDERFDYVLLIGVLEYAAVFSTQENPFAHYLQSVTRLLGSGGRVVVAIENKLGLKYFNGCAEDHVGIPFFGIEDLYGTQSARTFGRVDLKAQLSAAGLSNAQFYYPFPDYKLPSVVLSEEALSDPAFNAIDLLARSHARDYNGSPFRSFDDALALSVLHDNRLLADLSNSFLVVATAEPPAENAPAELAAAYSVYRAAEFCAQTRFVRGTTNIQVLKELLTTTSAHPVVVPDGTTITHRVDGSVYRPGRQLLWRLLKARARSGNLNAVVEALRPWMEFLLQHARVPVAYLVDVAGGPAKLAAYKLPGNFLDCTPFNVLDTGNELFAIDLEWHSDREVSLGWVVVRGVLYALLSGIPSVSKLQSNAEVIQSLAQQYGMLVSDDEIQAWMKQEECFQRGVSDGPIGLPTIELTSSGMHRWVGEISRLNWVVGERDGQVATLNQTIAARDECISDLNQTVHTREARIADLDRLLADTRQELGRVRDEQQVEKWQSAENIGQLQEELLNFTQQLSTSRQQLELIESSASWRATRVFRTVLARYPRVRRGVKRALRLIWWTATLQLPTRLRARRRLLRDRELIADSPLFDADWYLRCYPDVAAAGWDSALHYAQFGASEPRNPGPQFDAVWYLERNGDLTESGCNPLLHYIRFGRIEGRLTRLVSESHASLAAKDSEETEVAGRDYQDWISRYDLITDADAGAIRHHIATFHDRPLISVVMPVYNPEPRFLLRAIDSVIAQLYQDWELCIADDASPNPEIRTILEQYARDNPCIKVAYRPQRGHISAASNSALDLVTGDFVALMDHDDELPIHALYMVAVELNDHSDADIIYSDEDNIDAEGRRSGPYFKTDWNPELFYSQNMVNHIGVYRTSLVRQVGGFRVGFEGSQDYDLVLRIVAQTRADRIRHIPHVLYHWRRGDGVQTFSTDYLPDAVQAAHRALADYFASRGEKVQITASRIPYWNRVVRRLPDPAPRVSLIVPTRDKATLLRNCVEGLLHRTRYSNLEIIIIDNGSREPATLDYLESLRAESRVRIFRIDEPFNYAAFNNRAGAKAEGEIIGFINNDIEVIASDWLEEMVSQVVQPGVGAVGAKLYYSDNTVQHAGVVLGMSGVAGHPHSHRLRSDPGYFGRLQLVHNLSCVTAACMLMPKQVFQEVGGFDEINLKVSYNDVDLCLETREAGYEIVWTPYAELYHLESASRGSDLERENTGRARREYGYMQQRWGALLDHDPFYSPNLSLQDKEFSLAFPPRVSKPWRSVRVNDRSDSGHGRIISDAQQEWNDTGRSRLQKLLAGTERLLFQCPKYPTLSVIVVLHNKDHLSLLCLESLRRNADVSYELIVVDNASSDDTRRLLDRLDGATVLRNARNVGFGPACMQAVERSRGDYLCFLNNDALLQSKGFTSALDNLIMNPSVGAVGGKILLANGDLQEAGSIIWADGTALGYGRGYDADLPQYNFRRPVDFCSGAFLFTPRNLFCKLEGFDPRYAPAYYEDADYCMKVWACGLQVIYDPRAVILHYESASSANTNAATALMTTNHTKFVANWSGRLQDRHLSASPQNMYRARFAAASRNRHLLYFDDNVPHRHLGAGYPRSNAILHQIVRQGYQVTCVATSSSVSKEDYADIPYDVELVDARNDGDKLGYYLAASDLVWISRPNNMERYLREVVTRNPHRNYKVIYDAEAIFAERDYLECIIKGSQLPPDTLPAWITRELAPAKAADTVVCVSSRDADRMAEAGVSSPKVIGHYLEVKPTPTPFDKRRDFLFVGRMHGGDDPNTDSMRYFCETVWPHLRDITGANLIIAGQGSDMFPQVLKIPSIRVLGAVDDLSKLYDHSRVFVVPTRYAAGIPLKLYEAASFGLPAVVSTLIGEQTGWEHGEECLIAGTPAEFVDWCGELYWDEALWNRLRAQSLRKIESELNLRTFASAVNDVLNTSLGQ